MKPWVDAGVATEADETDAGIPFQLDWGTKQFNAFLRHQFPQLFAYFDSINPGFKAIPDEPDTVGMKRIEYSLPYVLLQKVRKNYLVVDNTHPAALEYKTYLSGDGGNAGFRAKGIFIGEHLHSAPISSRCTNLTPPPSYQRTGSPSGTGRVVCSIPCPCTSGHHLQEHGDRKQTEEECG